MTLTAEPPDVRPRRVRLRGPVATVAGLAAATVALRLRDPHEAWSWGVCPLALLGIHCPGCGGLRAVNDLTHGDLAAAASSNLLLVVAIPFVVLALARWGVDAWHGRQRGRAALPSGPVLYVGIAAMALFTVARNLPGSWLAP